MATDQFSAYGETGPSADEQSRARLRQAILDEDYVAIYFAAPKVDLNSVGEGKCDLPLCTALAAGTPAAILLLRTFGARLDATRPNGETPAQYVEKMIAELTASPGATTERDIADYIDQLKENQRALTAPLEIVHP